MPDNTGIYEMDNQPGGGGILSNSGLKVEGTCEEILLFPQYNEQYPVYVNMLVWRQLWQYACDNKDREIGGVLLGSVLHDDSGEGLNIQAYLPGRHMEETLANLTFTHKTWTDINQRLMREHNDKRIIGWFHTHPGHGIFMSRYDLYIHQNYFAGEGQVAVVFDPVHNSAGFFQRRDDRMLQLRRIHIYTMPGDAFDPNTRDFIARVGQHSQPQCQPTLGLPSFRIDIQNSPAREARHQGLAFLVQLMDIRKQDKNGATTKETNAVPEGEGSAVEGAPVNDQAAVDLSLDGGLITLPLPEENTINADLVKQGTVTSRLEDSTPTRAEVIGQLGENLDLYSENNPAAPSKVYRTQDGTPLPGNDMISPLSSPSEPDSLRRISHQVDEERLDMVKKKLTPIKNQVARDLRQAEREILSPSGNKRSDYKSNTPYHEGFDADAINIMM
ncbi:MAG: hypothetical protein ACM3PE_02360 [Deltaproteobacteria bacterium]